MVFQSVFRKVGCMKKNLGKSSCFGTSGGMGGGMAAPSNPFGGGIGGMGASPFGGQAASASPFGGGVYSCLHHAAWDLAIHSHSLKLCKNVLPGIFENSLGVIINDPELPLRAGCSK